MSDPVICCVLGICCPDGSERQREELAAFLDGNRELADRVLNTFDLAPKDSLGAFKSIIARLVKGNSQRG